MYRFFAAETTDDQVFLDREESKHLTKVLRLKAGDKVEATRGKGDLLHCEVKEAHVQNATLTILSKEQTKEAISYVEIAAAPTKNSKRWEWFLEKATEIGIDAIHPFTSKNSERQTLKSERQNRILKSAMKQSQQLKLPALSDIQKFESILNIDFKGEKYIAHCRENNKIPLSKHPSKTKALILIGPEGDFTAEEVAMAEKHGFKAISLGKNRLRTETAAIVACHTINLINA